MNNSYLSSSSKDYSFEYYSPSTPAYFYSTSCTTCPVHSPHLFYSSPIQSMNMSPVPYSYYQQQPQVFSSSDQRHTSIPTDSDRTPLRRHQCFKKHELEILHRAYFQEPYPSIDVLQQLSVQLNVSIEKVRQWFKNRRHSDKQKKRPTT
ncbi:unnamed protein product [Rotaria sp. Silwood2]|nr:unnamed protein product [Rotaria sp. Silwood2]CAF3014763.1 unnamed protein product [Rotaria sp. Silwood2]CAF4212298.1 unnamed protein product [Rotaria sp. Silwood2]CAF4403202.1 unnamed protein product [Rotaria sp. Silwood2]CAF4428088.1 unnamed protein product [Rotaria sp. Silwood2]